MKLGSPIDFAPYGVTGELSDGTGTLSDARLSSTVTNLGDSIETSEITSLDSSKLTGTIANARLDIGTLSTQDADNVDITGTL